VRITRRRFLAGIGAGAVAAALAPAIDLARALTPAAVEAAPIPAVPSTAVFNNQTAWQIISAIANQNRAVVRVVRDRTLLYQADVPPNGYTLFNDWEVKPGDRIDAFQMIDAVETPDGRYVDSGTFDPDDGYPRLTLMTHQADGTYMWQLLDSPGGIVEAGF